MKGIKIFIAASIYFFLSCSGSSSSSSNVQATTTPAEPATQPAVSNSQPATVTPDFTCTMDGVKWEGKGGNYSPYQYYPKGYGGKGEVFLQLGFFSTADGKQEILLALKQFDGQPGTYNGDKLSATFTNPGNGLYSNDDRSLQFDVQITKWEKISDKQAKVSGKASGSLKQISKGSKTMKIENGEFNDLTVDIL